ncbi:MAG: imidazoleglycerol-phosphate dehydratase [Gemmatimonadetes bacterium]|nr:imidazoleglycerol-phosphate dehydratase [Gemmatimonadota bacterium]
MSRIERETKETRIVADVRLGGGPIEVATGDAFLDHMLNTLARYAGLGLRLEGKGDLRHHLIEDAAITLGAALAREVPERAERYGWALVPMDEALVQAAVDVGGRGYYEGRLPSALYEHALRSFATNLGATLHVRVLRGRDRHHVVEAAVKATGLALRQALEVGNEVFSTKGAVVLKDGGAPKAAKSTRGPLRRPGRRKG